MIQTMSWRTRASQLGGMVSYEFRMHWRRRGLLVITLAILAMIGLFVLLISGNREGLADQLGRLGTGTSPDNVYQFISTAIGFLTWTAVGPTLIFILPIVVADTVTLDKQQGVSELLDSLPLPGSGYLAGKVLGVWAATLFALVVMMVLTGIIWQIQAAGYGVGFDLGAYVGLWAIGGGSLVIINGSFGTLIGATQPTRRRAFLLVGLLCILPTILLGTGIFDNSLWAYLNPMRGPMLNYYMNAPLGALDGSGPINLLPTQVSLTILVGAAESASLWLMVWGWRRWREARG